MNREDIAKMAADAGFITLSIFDEFIDKFEVFANKVASAERERCAQICDSVGANAVLGTAGECARAIRGQ